MDDAVSMIKRLGRGCFLAKTDIKSAFHIIPIRPADYFSWVFFGKGSIIMIALCQWDVHHHVELSGCLAQLLNGLLSDTC